MSTDNKCFCGQPARIFEAKNGGDSYVAISVKDYENLAKNFAELRRYIEQQKSIILYYEKAVQPDPADTATDD